MAVPSSINSTPGCQHCSGLPALDFEFSMAFQPLVDVSSQTIFGYEALVRGPKGESAYSILSQVEERNRYAFDQACRVKAIKLASKLQLNSVLSINFLPNAVYKPERCIRTTLEAAQKYGFPTQNILFEFTENEQLIDHEHLKRLIEYYHKLGFRTAIDDFGAGYSGLRLLADFQTDVVKIDMELIRGIEQDKARQIILRNCLTMFGQLGVTPLAEGVETKEEYLWLKQAGIEIMQGYLFAKPAFEALPQASFPSD